VCLLWLIRIDRNSRDPGDIFRSWNGSLRVSARNFAEKHKDCTVLLFSAYQTFDMFLDDPETNGFPADDTNRMGGAIWVDHLHPTSKVHDIVARDLADFLTEISAFTE
jgi:lysophospholipase L1-like esterase